MTHFNSQTYLMANKQSVHVLKMKTLQAQQFLSLSSTSVFFFLTLSLKHPHRPIVTVCQDAVSSWQSKLIIQSPKMLHKVDIGLFAVWEVALSCQNLYSFFLITYSFKNGARICPMYLSEFTACIQKDGSVLLQPPDNFKQSDTGRTMAPVTYHECHPPPQDKNQSHVKFGNLSPH